MATAQKQFSVRKIALVIGIGQYADGSHLPNAINDAEDVTNALKQIGFHIDEPKLNLTYRNMEHVLTDFKHSLNTGDLVLFYFSGHGTQWEDQNYLIPSDNLEISGSNLRKYAINAQDVLDRINSREPLATLFILDCCRRYHFRNQDLDRRDRATAIHQPKGLKEMSNEHESLVVFACAAGATADDQLTGRNGLFTKHLLQHIHSPNEHVHMMLLDVMKGVKQESKSQQIPYIYSSLTNRRLFLNETIVGGYSSNTSTESKAQSTIAVRLPTRNCSDLSDHAVLNKEVRIVLLGNVGSGRSSFGNTLLGDKIFKAQRSAMPVTRLCTVGKREYKGKSLIVLDTPGFFDSKLPKREIEDEIAKSCQILAPGPHAFLIVYNICNRISEEQLEVAKSVSDIFGNNAANFCVLVFTGLDGIEDEYSSIEEYLHEFRFDSNLKRLLKNYGERYIAVNNRGDNTHKEKVTDELLCMIDKMVLKTADGYYSTPKFKEVANVINKLKK